MEEIVPHPLHLSKYDIITDDDILTKMLSGCQEVPRKPLRDQLRVFCYPGSKKSSRNEDYVIQERIRSFLQSLQFRNGHGVLVQFWAPSKGDNGQTMLTIVKQPFGIDKFYNGLCWYRNIRIGDEQMWSAGDGFSSPIWRAFTLGFPEYIPVGCYKKEEFPFSTMAVDYGIKGYLALPLFERDDRCQQQCIGVLEFISLNIATGNEDFRPWNFHNALEDANFLVGAGKSHFLECHQNRKPDGFLYEVMENEGMVNALQKEKVPLVQLWVPCMCDLPNSQVSNTTTLFAEMSSYLGVSNTTTLYRISNYFGVRNLKVIGNYCVKNGKSWVERAYSQKKICFYKYTHHFNILDYPLLPLTRSCGLAACISIPLPLIHPDLPPSVLEVFLPPEKQYSTENHQEVIPLLKKLLSKVDHLFSEPNQVNDKVSEPKGELKFDICFSHMELNFVFFDIYRNGKFLNKYKAKNSKQQIIPYEESIQQGKTRKDAARELGVSKKKKVHHPQSNPRLTSESEEEEEEESSETVSSKFSEEQESSETVPEPEIKPFPNNNARDGDTAASNPTQTTAKGKSTAMASGNKIDDGSFTMNIMATYGGDNIKIEFSSRSGIEELRREVEECFDLGGKKLKIKYEENGRWFMIPRDKDLHKYMDSLKAKGENTMNVSIFPAT